MEGTHQVLGARVVGTGGRELRQAVLLPRGLALRAGVEGADHELSRARRPFADSATAWLTPSKNSLAVPDEFARPTAAIVKAGSLARACSKSGRASVGAQLLLEVASLQIELLRLARGRR
jgi:hypothetical protein